VAKQVKDILHKTDGVVDIDWTNQSNGIQTGSRKGKQW
jgi:hypothetical protein